VVVKKIGSFFFRNSFTNLILDAINSGQLNPRGDEGSIKPLHISTIISAGDFPIPVEYDSISFKIS
jgi:hypothetical protein